MKKEELDLMKKIYEDHEKRIVALEKRPEELKEIPREPILSPFSAPIPDKFAFINHYAIAVDFEGEKPDKEEMQKKIEIFSDELNQFLLKYKIKNLVVTKGEGFARPDFKPQSI